MGALEQRANVELEPPPGVPIRTAWLAGRVGIGFDDEGALGLRPMGAALDPGPDRPRTGSDCIPVDPHLILLRDLDVDDRPFLWDLEA